MASASAHRGVALLVLLLVAMAGTVSLVQANTCPTDPTELEVCEGAVVPGGGNPNSYPGCCPAVSGWGLDCLCELVTEYGSSLESSIDINKCLAMPAECGVYVPPNYTCDDYDVPSS